MKVRIRSLVERPCSHVSSSPRAFDGPFGLWSIQQKTPAGFLPVRWVGANPLKSPFTGSKEMATSVPILFGIFIAPRGVSAAVQTISGKCADTSVSAFFFFLTLKETVICNTITKQDEDR